MEGVFQTALALSGDDQAALWARLEAQIKQERIAWVAFAAVMTRLRSRLQPAIECVSWPARLKTIFPEGGKQ